MADSCACGCRRRMYAAGLADEAEKILNKEQVSDSLPFVLLHGKIEPNSSGARIDNRR